MSIAVQYIIVGIILVLSLIWVWRRIRCRNAKKRTGCEGCALRDKCVKSKG